MKARAIKGLDPAGRLDDAMAATIAVRLDELCAYMPRAADPAEVEHLHDMRIAAKRLRYVLELTAFCFGPYAEKAARRARHLQEVIGEIHDCDVSLPRVLELQAEIDPQDPAAPGLETIAASLRARRDEQHFAFLRLWHKLGREGFRARLEFALDDRPRTDRFHESFTGA